MLTGGRIVVAIVGAVVLVVAGVLVVRSVWWDTTSTSTPFTASSLSAGPSSTVPGGPPPDAGAGSADAGSGGAGGDPGAGSSTDQGGQSDSTGSTTSGAASSTATPTTTPPTTSSAAPVSRPAAFTATTKQVNKILGSVSVDVEIPQVTGSDTTVATAFNKGVESLLIGQAGSAGTLQNRDGSGVRIGARVLSGVLATSLSKTGGDALPLTSTLVVDATTGETITTATLFDDEATGLATLAQLVKTLGPRSHADFDASAVKASADQFTRWSAESAGMKVYFAQGTVAPASDGVVDVTIPWTELSGVLNASVADVVRS
jgi:hypothetical protein